MMGLIVWYKYMYTSSRAKSQLILQHPLPNTNSVLWKLDIYPFQHNFLKSNAFKTFNSLKF